MSRARTPNQPLRALLGEAGWSGADLARAVNRAGADEGVRLHYDRTTVAHWLSGSRPAAPVPALVAEVLSRALGRRITVPETQLGRPDARSQDQPGPVRACGGTRLARLAVVGPEPHQSRSPVYSLAHELLPGFPAVQFPEPGRVPGRIGSAQVRVAESVLAACLACEESLGGGTVHQALVGFLTTVVGEWLRAPGPPVVRRELMLCAARLAYLAGFTSFDARRQGLAQEYYNTAAQLAAEGVEARLYATALRALSVQAHYLGHRRHSRGLADAAAAQRTLLSPREAAFVTGQQAVAAAAMGERTTAFAHLDRTRRLLEAAGNGACRGIASYHWASYAHQEAEALAALGDIRGAIGALTRSARERAPQECRARAVVNARLAQLLLSQGDLDHACASWHSVLDDYPLLASGRMQAAVGELRAQLRPHASSTAAQAVLTRAARLQR